MELSSSFISLHRSLSPPVATHWNSSGYSCFKNVSIVSEVLSQRARVPAWCPSTRARLTYLELYDQKPQRHHFRLQSWLTYFVLVSFPCPLTDTKKRTTEPNQTEHCPEIKIEPALNFSWGFVVENFPLDVPVDTRARGFQISLPAVNPISRVTFHCPALRTARSERESNNILGLCRCWINVIFSAKTLVKSLLGTQTGGTTKCHWHNSTLGGVSCRASAPIGTPSVEWKWLA